jgi:Dehydrogenases (flavoproteins)
MKVTEASRKTHVIHTCDVLIAGGGIAGIAAALAAVRSGVSVALIEKSCILGGLATSGLITIYLPLCDGMGEQVSFGIAEELFHLSIKHGAEARYPTAWLDGGTIEDRVKQRFEVQYNPHIFAIEAEQLLLSLGVKIFYDTLISNVITDNDKVSHIIIENKSGRSAVKVKSVVDATGDADICKFANADTVNFRQGNVLANWYYCMSHGELRLKMLGASDIPDKHKTNEQRQHLSNRRFTGLDGIEISEMLCMGHEKMLADILKARETDKDYTPVTMPTIPQLRMTRRIDGIYTLDDTEIRTPFDDSIGLISDWRKRGPVYAVPFSTLYGAKIKNIIAAGRCISVSDAMWDITRVIPVCAVTGEAAGIAAAMSDDFANIDVKTLQNELQSRSVKINF